MKRKPADPEGSPPPRSAVQRAVDDVVVQGLFNGGLTAAVAALVSIVEQQADTRSKSKQAPRKPVTKDELEAFRDAYLVGRLRDRGWKNAACLEFGITDKTLKKRMSE